MAALSSSSFLFIAALITPSLSGSWSYTEPATGVHAWKNDYPECGFSRQSPINIPADAMEMCSERGEQPLELEWTSQKSHFALRNTGYSLKAVAFEINHSGGEDLSGLEVQFHANDTKIRLKNKFYSTYKSEVHQEYCFDSLHFHWGETSDDGSEHLIGGGSYPLELHLVHYSCSYRQAGDALGEYASGNTAFKYDDANVLAVIGVIFEIGDPNPALENIVNKDIVDKIHVKQDQDYDELISLYYTEFNLRDLLPESKEMIHYLGSLTTPPCYETVRWHVMKQKMTVSEEQMELFRRMLQDTNHTHEQAPNFRNLQSQGERKIISCQSDLDTLQKYSKRDVNSSSDDDAWRTVSFAFIALTLVLVGVFLVMGYFLVKYSNQLKQFNSRNNDAPKPLRSETLVLQQAESDNDDNETDIRA